MKMYVIIEFVFLFIYLFFLEKIVSSSTHSNWQINMFIKENYEVRIK